MAAIKKTRKWKPILLVKIYRLARLGVPEREMCAQIGISRKTLFFWKKEFPELREAFSMAAHELADGESMPAWMYKHLTPEMGTLWEKILIWSREEDGLSKVEMMLEDHGKKVRQQLFLYALCVCKFSCSRAMKKVLITKKELDKWLLDPEFRDLMEEVEWHKGNFFEESLVKLVKEGNPQAVLFANKTFNKSRGYMARSEIDVNHSGMVMHGIVDLGELLPFLSKDSKLDLMAAIRKAEESKLPSPILTTAERVEREIAVVAEESVE